MEVRDDLQRLDGWMEMDGAACNSGLDGAQDEWRSGMDGAEGWVELRAGWS